MFRVMELLSLSGNLGGRSGRIHGVRPNPKILLLRKFWFSLDGPNVSVACRYKPNSCRGSYIIYNRYA